jgi:hypothetical protein
LQTAASVFLGKRPFTSGIWDETSLWLSERTQASDLQHSNLWVGGETPHIVHFPGQNSWAYLRIAQFNSRPGHADQLHLDIWRHGMNLAQDAGTFLYTAPAPWDNALAHTAVHNTLSINDQEQMRRTGRFLYLDWAQAERVEGEQNADGSWRRLVAWHAGYRRLGAWHQRSVSALQNGNWQVEDTLLPINPKPTRLASQLKIRLHWLLPDWPWELAGSTLQVLSPVGKVGVTVGVTDTGQTLEPTICLARAGQNLLDAQPVPPTWGWVSPTYSMKQPALSFSATALCSPGAVFTTRWSFSVE